MLTDENSAICRIPLLRKSWLGKALLWSGPNRPVGLLPWGGLTCQGGCSA